jgi:hypothetical protein
VRRDRDEDDAPTERKALEKACRAHLADLRANAKWPVDLIPTPRDGRGSVRATEATSGCSSAFGWD